MQTGILVALAALSLVGVGVVGASGVMAPTAGGMGAGMGGGMMGGGSGMHQGPMMDPDDMMGGGACGCQTNCQQHNYAMNHSYAWGS